MNERLSSRMFIALTGATLMLAVGCAAAPAPTATPGLTDAETLWCSSNVTAVYLSGLTIGSAPPSDLAAVQRIEGIVGADATAELKAYMMGQLLLVPELHEFESAWRSRSPATFERACKAAFAAR